MGFNHSALIGFGGAGSAGLQDSVFPQTRSSGTPVFTGVASSVNCPYPATISANDILFILTRVTDTLNLTSATAAGFTEVNRTGGGGATSAVVLLWKRAVGSESGTLGVTISGGGGGTQTVWAVMWSVKNCITSGTPYAGNDTSTGGGPPGSDWVSNPFTTATANSGGMHVVFQNNSTLTTIFGWTSPGNIGSEDPQITASSSNSVWVDYFRCDTVGTYFTNTTTGATDATIGAGKSFFSMELLR